MIDLLNCLSNNYLQIMKILGPSSIDCTTYIALYIVFSPNNIK